jgi:hypothetical protein
MRTHAQSALSIATRDRQFNQRQSKEITMSVIKASTKRTVTAPAFNAHAANIVREYGKFDRASANFADQLSRTMNAYVDACRVAPGMDKGKESCAAMQKAIKNADAFVRAVADGLLESKTITEYAQGAARALHYGVEWTANLKNDPTKALPWGKAGKGGASKAGKVTSTSREDLDKTLSKAIAQARMLGLTEFAAQVLDVAIESLDGFKETAE